MLNLTAGGLSGGYKKYLRRVVPLLQQHSAVSELLVALPPGLESAAGDVGDVWSWDPAEHWRGFPALAGRVREWKPDVVMVPTARVINCNAPCVSMVQNMEPMLPPTLRDGAVALAKNLLRAAQARRACARAARVIAVSQFVRDYLVREWHLDGGRVGVVYHGVDQADVAPQLPAEFKRLANTPFVFVAGSLLPYRGVEDAIGALQDPALSTMHLAIAGDGSAEYRARMQALAESCGVASRVLWLGHVPESAMGWGYKHCVAYLMTSRVEACPNTALEAMVSGAFCISTRSLPMPEFFRECALYYDAGHAQQLAAQLRQRLAMSDADVSSLRACARERSLDFSWQETANGTVLQLEAAHARGLT